MKTKKNFMEVYGRARALAGIMKGYHEEFLTLAGAMISTVLMENKIVCSEEIIEDWDRASTLFLDLPDNTVLGAGSEKVLEMTEDLVYKMRNDLIKKHKPFDMQ